MRLTFVRHGETRWNLEGRYQGHADLPLCATGCATARHLAQRFCAIRAQLLLTSPLSRTAATASLIGEALGDVACVIDERLIEIDFGDWQGLNQAEIKVRWPDLLRRWKRAPESVRFPRGESLLDALERLKDFLTRPPWPADAAGYRVVAVSHASPIRLAGLLAEGRPLAHFRDLRVEPGAVREFEWRTGGRLRRIEFGSTWREGR